MVEDYLSDREQEEAIKAWWLENWRWILSGVVLGLALLGAWRYWQYRQADQNEHAAQVFHDLELASESKDVTRVDTLVKQLTDHYDATPYADQARLLQAKGYVEGGKLDEAVTLLRSVADHTKDDNLARIARLRVARVLGEQGKYDDALKLLDPVKAGAFVALTHETRGDVLLAKGDVDAARGEYQAALESPDAESRQRSPSRELLELKLQDLGEATLAKAAVTGPATASSNAASAAPGAPARPPSAIPALNNSPESAGR